MLSFVYNSLRQMLNSTYLCLLCLYGLLSYMIVSMGYTQKGFMSSEEVLSSYNMIIMSLVTVNSVYFIISHFRETLNSSMRDALIARLGKYKYFWGLMTCYIVYLTVFNIIPLYLTALLQQLLNSHSGIDLQYYLTSYASAAWEAGFWPVLLSVIIIVWLKNDLLTLLVWAGFYLVTKGASAVLSMYKTSDGTNPFSGVPLIINSVLLLLTIVTGVIICRRLTEYEYNEKISGGIFAFIAGRLRFELSKFHYRMLGLKTQSLYLIFGSAGFILTLSFMSGMGADNTVICKIFSAVFLPLMFSFNQYNLVAVDLESGMAAVNILRKTGYEGVVLNRWFTMLVPQIVFSLLFSFLLINSAAGPGIPFVILVLMLNFLFSSMNLFLAVTFSRPGYANFIVGFIAYIMLREDIQKAVTSNPFLNTVNIFGSITSFTNHTPAPAHIIISAVIPAALIILARGKIKRIQYRII